MISIVDYGVGNLGSVLNMIKKIGGTAEVVSKPEQVMSAKKLLLPGVGAFDAGIQALNETGMGEAVKQAVNEQDAFVFGICLGMQLLLENSEEGEMPGLGLVPGVVKKFDAKALSLRVPHMGWNITVPKKNSVLFDLESEEEFRFYFVHSYYAECSCPDDIASITNYGGEFVSSFQRGNVVGAQFHPEKSHRFGMALMKRYSELKC